MQKNRLLAMIMLLLLTLSLLFCLGAFAYSGLRRLHQRQQVQTLTQLQKEKANLAALRSENGLWLKAGEELKRFTSSTFIRSENFSRFQERLNGIFFSCQMNPPTTKFIYSRLADGYMRFTKEFTIDSSYANIKKLIHEIAAIENMVFLDNIELNYKGQNLTNGKFQLEGYIE